MGSRLLLVTRKDAEPFSNTTRNISRTPFPSFGLMLISHPPFFRAFLVYSKSFVTKSIGPPLSPIGAEYALPK